MFILEVIASSLDDAIAAERGGAHRLEIVRALELGGLTPPVSLVRQIVEYVTIPVRVMLRENPGFEAAGEPELERLCDAAHEFAALGVQGLVLGFLRGRALDLESNQHVLGCAPTLRATFHRGFEKLDDPETAIAQLETVPQFDRILISPSDVPGFARIAELAAPEMGIIAGGGLNAGTIRTLRSSTDIREFHVGRAARRGGRLDQPVEAARVRDLLAAF